MSRKCIKEFVRELKKAGWSINQGRGHFKARHPETDKLLTFSNSPSCPHAVKNAKRDIRKMEKGIY